jgi:hypothetical protein
LIATEQHRRCRKDERAETQISSDGRDDERPRCRAADAHRDEA